MDCLKKDALRKDREWRLESLNNDSMNTANTYRFVLGDDYVDNNKIICEQNRKRVY